MSNDALDLAFARHVRQIGLITAEQVNAALQAQAKSLQSGKPISVAEAFVTLGLLTPAQRESLEKKVKEQQAGIHQLGPYKLMKKLGEGGMGAVYLALDPSTNQHVAVKVLPRHLGANAEFVKRFRREAEAATKLKHPNIIGAFAAGEDLGYHYYVMEYCEGKALDQVLAAEKQLDVSRALDVVLQAARGLKYAHDQGIIHRDIKPSNIIVAQNGTAKILDLGLSKSLEDSSVSFKTVTGAVLGTPHYISPEQAQGEKNVDGRTDIYSLGATLYHLLTGKVPFDGATALEILSKHVNTTLPNPQDLREDIPDPAVHILLRMMAKEPRDRYRDCAELITDLEEVGSGRTPKTHVISAALTTVAAPRSRERLKKRPATVRRTVATAPSRMPLYAGVGGAAAVVIVLAVVFSSNGDPQPPPPAPKAAAPPPRAPEPAPRAAFDVAAWEQSLANSPPEAQLKAVVSRLKDLNPGYDGSEKHETGHGRISRLELGHVALRDLSPLRALTTLGTLDLSGSGITDLSALKDLPITSLSCGGMKSVDLKSIRAMKKLKILSLKSAAVRDLSPLVGMDLWQLDLRSTGLSDLSPLRQIKLLELSCDFDAKRDAEVLKSLSDLEKINDRPVEEFWRRERAPDAPAPPSSEDLLRSVLAKLKQQNPEHDGRALPLIENGVVIELSLSALALTDLSPLQELKGLRRLDVSGYWDPVEKKEYRGGLSNLAPLRSLKLESLRLHHTGVADLEALRGMKLDTLDLLSTYIRDLSPLRGMPLKKLDVSYTKVADLSPLEGMPLVELKISTTNVTDFSPLKTLQLQTLWADLDPQKHRALLTGMPSLQWINGVSPSEFLKTNEKPAPGPATPKPPPVPPPSPDAAAWKNAVDLIALVEPQRDAQRGNWKKENGRIISEFGENGVLRIPYEPPAEYDFKIVFTRARGSCAVAQFLQRDGRGFFWEMAGWGNVNSGFSLVKGKGSRENPTNSNFVPRDGVKYTCVIQVRRDRVTALLDDKKISEWLPAMGEITTDTNWCVDMPNLIGIGNCESLTTFEVVQVREVTGKGKIRIAVPTTPDPAFLGTVARLPAADQVKRVVEKLKELNPYFDPDQVRSKIENDRVVEFATSTQKLIDLWPVRAFPALRKLDLSDEGNPGMLADISCLKGLKLQELNLQGTKVADLAPLTGMPLTSLELDGTRVTNLAPLRTTKLTSLVISNTPVTDVSPLKDVPLQRLEAEKINGDLSPLKGHRTLKTINDVAAAEFFRSTKEGWVPIFDRTNLDCLRKSDGWKLEKGAMVNYGEGLNAAQTTQEFENGDLKVRFEVKGADSCMFRVRQSDAGAWGVLFDGQQCRALDGRIHELIFTCRGAGVTATLDGKPWSLQESKPVRSGCFQFNVTGGTIRVFSIDFRAAP